MPLSPRKLYLADEMRHFLQPEVWLSPSGDADTLMISAGFKRLAVLGILSEKASDGS
jgi:hypothetical protein